MVGDHYAVRVDDKTGTLSVVFARFGVVAAVSIFEESIVKLLERRARWQLKLRHAQWILRGAALDRYRHHRWAYGLDEIGEPGLVDPRERGVGGGGFRHHRGIGAHTDNPCGYGYDGESGHELVTPIRDSQFTSHGSNLQ